LFSANRLAWSGPIAAGVVYWGWLAADSGGFDACGAFSQTYGSAPLWLLSVAAVAARARLEHRRWRSILILMAVAAFLAAAILIFVALWWFGTNQCAE
jgi:hypothetical protein